MGTNRSTVLDPLPSRDRSKRAGKESRQLTGPEWICARCGVTTRFMEGAEVPSLPSNWSRVSGVTYCLACRRELAGEQGAATIPEDGPADDRRRSDAEGRIAFEIRRAPDQGDT